MINEISILNFVSRLEKITTALGISCWKYCTDIEIFADKETNEMKSRFISTDIVAAQISTECVYVKSTNRSQSKIILLAVTITPHIVREFQIQTLTYEINIKTLDNENEP